MKNSINSAIIIAVVSFFAISSTSFCSKPEDKQKDKENVKSENTISEKSQKDARKIAPKDVKYIWKDMPSYDRYGNEITGRARLNMEQNRLLQQQKSQEEKNITESREVK